MSVGAAIALRGDRLALGILISETTKVPFALEAGMALGALVGWRAGRNRG
jgi:hypothetical protein